MDEKRWTVGEPQGERALIAPNGEPFWRGEFESKRQVHKHFDALCDQVEQSNQAPDDALPTMTGWDVAACLRAGQTVEAPNLDTPPTWVAVGNADWWSGLTSIVVVARVVPPVEPVTERVPWWEVIATGRTVTKRAPAIPTFVPTQGIKREDGRFDVRGFAEGEWRWVTTDANGLVEVQAEGEGR